MCVILDVNVIPVIFDSKAKNHKDFAPIRKWITEGKGSVVYGGTKYGVELGRLKNFLRIIAELSRNGKLVVLPTEDVDAYALKLKSIVHDSKFNDEHLVAIVACSNCRIICTADKESHPYLCRKDLYPKGVKRPKIYSKSKHVKLCSDSNIVAACKGSSISR